MLDWLVVGAGFAGSVIAERLASQRGDRVLLIDRRNHVGGNAYDHHDANGILIHQYGPHIFHTNSEAIVEYLSAFTGWWPYEHRVLAAVDGQLLPIPINRTTINRLYGLGLESEDDVEAFYSAQAENIANVTNSEDVVVSRVGRDLYEKFFRVYTLKQWGLDPSELDKSVTARVPARANDDDRYFLDSFQAMPLHGYTRMFERMLSHPNITVMLEAEYVAIRRDVHPKQVIYTGAIDEYFDFCYGKLPYRSLEFDHVTCDCEWYQPAAVINYPQDKRYTRITEYKHMTGQIHPRTSITFEYPTNDGDPYYPIPQKANQELYTRYRKLAERLKNVRFIGRLATYRYYNMDQIVGQALAEFRRIQAEVPAFRGQKVKERVGGSLTAR